MCVRLTLLLVNWAALYKAVLCCIVLGMMVAEYLCMFNTDAFSPSISSLHLFESVGVEPMDTEPSCCVCTGAVTVWPVPLPDWNEER